MRSGFLVIWVAFGPVCLFTAHQMFTARNVYTPNPVHVQYTKGISCVLAVYVVSASEHIFENEVPVRHQIVSFSGRWKCFQMVGWLVTLSMVETHTHTP